MKEIMGKKVPFLNNAGTEGVKKKRKKFSEPELQVYDNLTDITFFSSAQNVSGGVFF